MIKHCDSVHVRILSLVRYLFDDRVLHEFLFSWSFRRYHTAYTVKLTIRRRRRRWKGDGWQK